MDFRLARSDDWPLIWPIFEPIVAAGDTYTYDPDLTFEHLGFDTIGVVPGGFAHPRQGFVDLLIMYRDL